MRSNLDKALAYVFTSEGGFAERLTEPGGSVNMGISQQTLATWNKAHREPVPTVDDVRNLPKWKATEIYEKLYAEPIGFDALPSGVDYCALDAAVNEGVGWTRRIMRALPVYDADGVIDFVCDTRLAGKRKRAEWPQFGKGWMNRIEGVRVHAKAMAAAPQGK